MGLNLCRRDDADESIGSFARCFGAGPRTSWPSRCLLALMQETSSTRAGALPAIREAGDIRSSLLRAFRLQAARRAPATG
jgi:hypothetical protein